MKNWIAVLIALVLGSIGVTNIITHWDSLGPGLNKLWALSPGLAIGLGITFSLMVITGLLAVIFLKDEQ